MATFENLVSTAKIAQAFAQAMKDVRMNGRRLTDRHLAFDFSDVGSSPNYVELDDNGNFRGFTFGPSEYISMVILAQQLELLLSGQETGTPTNFVTMLERATTS